MNSFAALENLNDGEIESTSSELIHEPARSKKSKSKSSHKVGKGDASGQSGSNQNSHQPEPSPDAEEGTRSSKKREEKQEAKEGKSEAENQYLKNPIVWIDLEMTGLDPETDQILEIAVLITDGELSAPHMEGPDLAIYQPDGVLEGMNAWCVQTHGKSGLTKRCRESKISLEDAESQVLEFMQKFTEAMDVKGSAQHKAHLAGNSVYMDHAFLRKHMPRIFAHLHWRLIDISTLLELARRWFPEEFKKAPKKKVLHTAMADIRESLQELKFYRRHIFKQPGLSYREYLSATSSSKH